MWDINNDGVINVLDIMILVQVILGHQDPPDGQLIDFNGDDITNIQDVLLLINKILED